MTGHIPQSYSNSPLGVFVYGTLMRGFRFHEIARRAGLIQAEPALLEQHDIYDLDRGYPAVVPGEGQVWGEFMTFEDLPEALGPLDRLESSGREYERVRCRVKLTEHPGQERLAWVYRYPNLDAIVAAQGTHIPSGRYAGD